MAQATLGYWSPVCPKKLPRTQPLLGKMRCMSNPEGLVGGTGMGQGKGSQVLYPTAPCQINCGGASTLSYPPACQGPPLPMGQGVCCGQGAVAVWVPVW